MSEVEALGQIAFYLKRIYVELAGIDFMLMLLVFFKNMGGKQ